MRWLVDLVYLLIGLLYLPIALYHALIVGKNRHGWEERFGFVPTFDPCRQRIWIHGVSLGEINATPRLVEALRERLPDVEIVFSTTTDTGYARAVQLYGADRVFRFPLDFSPIVNRVLRRVDPSMVVLVELEIWYNLVRMATRRGIPVAVVNGRLTRHSGRRFRRLGRPGWSMFGDLVWVGAQDEAIASRFRSLGVPSDRVEVTSSLKWDSAAITDQVDGAGALARALGIDRSRPLWVCGSTGPGEEEMILDAYRRLLRMSNGERRIANGKPQHDIRHSTFYMLLAIIPRKPERFEEVARVIDRAGFTCIRRSDHHDGTEWQSQDALDSATPVVLLGDTMGELRKFYSLANVVFVGRSLVPLGGSDPMEVAALGKPIIVGPHTDNFRLPVEALHAADAIRIIESAEMLSAVVRAILSDGPLAERLGACARRVVIENQGATCRTADVLAARLKRYCTINPPSAGA